MYVQKFVFHHSCMCVMPMPEFSSASHACIWVLTCNTFVSTIHIDNIYAVAVDWRPTKLIKVTKTSERTTSTLAIPGLVTHYILSCYRCGPCEVARLCLLTPAISMSFNVDILGIMVSSNLYYVRWVWLLFCLVTTQVGLFGYAQKASLIIMELFSEWLTSSSFVHVPCL